MDLVVKGIGNLRITCYLNGVFQALWSYEPFCSGLSHVGDGHTQEIKKLQPAARLVGLFMFNLYFVLNHPKTKCSFTQSLVL